MKAQLEETTDAAVKVGLLREELTAEDALRQNEDYLRLTIDGRKRAETLLAGEKKHYEFSYKYKNDTDRLNPAPAAQPCSPGQFGHPVPHLQ